MIRKNIILLIKNKQFILFFLLLFFLNGVITYKTIKDQTIPAQNYLKIISWLKQEELPDEACSTYQKDLLSLPSEDIKFNATLYQEYSLVLDVHSYVDGIYHYQDSVAAILKNMDIQMIFYNLDQSTNENRFSKTKSIYGNLQNVQPVMGNYYALKAFFRLDFTDGIILLLIIAACAMLVIEERERGMYFLIKTAKRGGPSFFISKATSLILTSSVSTILFLAERLLIYIVQYKCDTWNVPIQSVPGYLLAPFNISISHFVILFFIIKIIVFSIIMVGVLCLCNLPFSSSVIYLAVGFMIAFNIGIYQGIDLASKYVLFKYMNFPALLDIGNMMNQLYFINIRNIYIRVAPFHLLLIFSLFLILFLVGIWFYLRYKKSFQLGVLRKRKGAFYGYHASINEAKRIMLQRGGFVLILILLFAGWYSNDFTKDMNENNLFFKNYVLKLNKMEPEQAEIWLSSRLADLHQMEKKKIELSDDFAAGKITEMAFQYASIEIDRQLLLRPIILRLMEQSDGIKQLKTDRNIIANYTFDPLFDNLFGEKGATNRYMNGVLLILISACLILPIFSHDRQYRTDKVLWVTRKGADSLLKSRCLILCISEVIMLLIIQGLQIAALNQKYGLIGFNSKVQSLTCFENFPIQMSVTSFLILLTTIKVICILLITIFLISISMLLKDVVFSLLIGTLILECPIIMSMLGFTPTKVYGFTPLIVPDILLTSPVLPVYANLLVIIFIIIVIFQKSINIWRNKNGG